MVAPAVHGVFEAADDGKAQRRGTRRQPVQQAPGLLGHLGQHRAHAAVGALLALPAALHILGQAVHHRPHRPQTNDRHHRVPEKHAKHMAVRCDHRKLDHMSHDFAAGNVPHLHLLPLGQQLARLLFVAFVQRIADVGEVVAELAKAQRHIEQSHVPQGRCEPAHTPVQQTMHQQSQRRRQQGGHAPGHPGQVLYASVQCAGHPAGPGLHQAVDRVVPAQRACLFQHQGQKDGEKAHRVSCPAPSASRNR